MIKINLLSEAKPTKRKKGVAALGGAGRMNVVLLVGMTMLGLLVCFVRWWMLRAETNRLDEEIRRAQAEVSRLEAVLREVQDFENKKARLQRKVDLINQLKANQRGPVRLMDEVSKALPDLLWLERMEVVGQDVGLVGKALNAPAVANYLENLKRQPLFQEPVLRFVSACGGGGQPLYCFDLGFTFANLEKVQIEEQPAAPAEGGAPAGAPKAEGLGNPPSHAAASAVAGM